jgi:hypothetical protein
MIAGTMGGKIVAGTVNGEPHYWNRLPCGTEVDLTSCQYGGDGFTPLAHAKIKRVRSKPKRIVPEFIFFAADVLRQLEQLGK